MAKYNRFPNVVPQIEGLQTVRKLREMIRRLWHIELAYADADGFVIDHARGKISPSGNPFCHKCLFDEEGLRRCDQTVVDITARLATGAYPKGGIFDDCHAGFKYVAVPVYISGQFLGSVVGGGFLLESPTPEKQEEILEATRPYRGAEIADSESAFRELPVLSRADVQFLIELILFGIEEVQQFQEEVAARERKIAQLHSALEEKYGYHSIVGKAQTMQRLYALLEKLKDSESTVLIQGDNGTGKEMVAKAIHFNSPRKDLRFISQNCSAFNENLLDSELFGHVKGSFTGAVRDKKGLFEAANGGTFFMDEIGDMSPALQVKLLRVLQEGVFIPVGGTDARKVDVRIIAATNRDLRQMVEDGKFREDLYYRLNVINIHVPALRERREDIPLLAAHFLKKYARDDEDRRKYFTDEALDALVAYEWPGNVRQLENEVQRVVVLAGKNHKIEKSLLSATILKGSAGVAQVKLGGKLKSAVEHVERMVLLEGLRRCRWNKTRLSQELGISRATLISKVEKYGLVKDHRP